MPFSFEYYLLMAPTYHEVAPKIDLDEETPKPTKKKTKTVSGNFSPFSTIVYFVCC